MDQKFIIENHINLLEDELKETWALIEKDIILYHRIPVKIFETRRSEERQKYLVENGRSKTMRSRHLPNTRNKSEAFDVVVLIGGKPSWDKESLPYYHFFGELVIEKFGDILEWGGHWKSFIDLPHFQMKKTYGQKEIIGPLI